MFLAQALAAGATLVRAPCTHVTHRDEQILHVSVVAGNLSSYGKRQAQDYDVYLFKRAELYRAEYRWPRSRFWAARQRMPDLEGLPA